MIRAASACARHRPVLVDLVDRGERGPATAAALDHLASCDACSAELTGIALTIASLRRAGAAYRSLPEPSLRRPAVEAPRRGAWGWHLRAGSLLAGAAIAALLVLPGAGMRPAEVDAQRTVRSRPVATITWQAAESRLANRPDAPSMAAAGTLPPRYPDGLLRPWKEVPRTDATARVFEPT